LIALGTGCSLEALIAGCPLFTLCTGCALVTLCTSSSLEALRPDVDVYIWQREEEPVACMSRATREE
jgi:hypothetical protein